MNATKPKVVPITARGDNLGPIYATGTDCPLTHCKQTVPHYHPYGDVKTIVLLNNPTQVMLEGVHELVKQHDRMLRFLMISVVALMLLVLGLFAVVAAQAAR